MMDPNLAACVVDGNCTTTKFVGLGFSAFLYWGDVCKLMIHTGPRRYNRQAVNDPPSTCGRWTIVDALAFLYLRDGRTCGIDNKLRTKARRMFWCLRVGSELLLVFVVKFDPFAVVMLELT